MGKKQNQPQKLFSCDVCKITTTNKNDLQHHLKGKKHINMLSSMATQKKACSDTQQLKDDKHSQSTPTPTPTSTPFLSSSNAWTLEGSFISLKYVCTLEDMGKYIESDDLLNTCITDGFCAIDCEGVPKSLDLIQIATYSAVYVIDCVILDREKICKYLSPIFQSRKTIKIFHDLHKDMVALERYGVGSFDSVLDSQLVAEHLWVNPLVGLNDMLETLEHPKHPLKSLTKKTMHKNPTLWSNRPLQKRCIEYAARDASLLFNVFHTLKDKIGRDWEALMSASLARVNFAMEQDGMRSICFDKANSYRIASAELLEYTRPQDVIKNETLVHESEIRELIELLPEDLRSKLVQDNTDSEPTHIAKYALSDIVLDVGREPWCWMENERIMLANEKGRKVTKDEIDTIISNIGGFGTDNRAGLEQKLHRISGMRDREGNVVGLTMRVGRWFRGNAAMLADFLLGCDKSVLILGGPGSGKTTIVREAVRVLAEHRNVCVVDTSNEIAGDGAIPHPCIGLARRMMVTSLDEQSRVMVECVQNHTPQIMVIDEIGRPREVEAARTVKQRGVRMIASAHGDLRNIIKNKELRGLVGGIESVTLGDAAAKEEMERKGSQGGARGISKTKTQRAGEPTFDVIVEVCREKLHEWQIVGDTAAAVDAILDGRQYNAQLRVRDPRNTAVFLELKKA